MRKYLLDTGIAGYFVNDRHQVRIRVYEALKRGDRIGICMPVLGEFIAGAEFSKDRENNRALIKESVRQLRIWPFDYRAAEQFGRLYAVLRRIGRPMQQIDIQIAAIALAMGNCTVVTMDGDFKSIPGLKIENWTE